MISKNEYELLVYLQKNSSIEEENHWEEIERLKKDHLIRYNILYDNFYDGYLVTPLGQRAIEEYKSFLIKEDREKQSLEISKKANQKSSISLWIAGISAFFALGSVITAIIALILH